MAKKKLRRIVDKKSALLSFFIFSFFSFITTRLHINLFQKNLFSLKMRDERKVQWGFPSLSRSDAQGVENVSVFVNQMQLKL